MRYDRVIRRGLIPSVRLLFDGFVFDSGERTLRRAGEPVHLTPKAFQLLEILLRERPQAVSRADLVRELWPATFVADGSLANLASELRSALADPPSEARLLRTVHRFGYSFCGTAKEEQSISRCRLLGPERDFPLLEGENLIGRGSECGVRIVSSTVSRVHARLLVDGTQATIEDMESKNGTYVGGTRLQAPARLSPGDEIRIGSVRLVWQGARPESATDSYHAAGD
jgi:DNA-binding winged helix-turn-helix (wHTH) protein